MTSGEEKQHCLSDNIMVMQFKDIFPNKPVIGMIHTNSDSEMSVLDIAKREIDIYLKYGIYPLVENYFGSEDNCEEVLEWLHAVHPNAIYGVNILGDYHLAFELAHKYGAKFIQIDSVCGHMKPEQEPYYVQKLNEHRDKYNVAVLGGVRFKYQDVLSGRTVSEDLVLGKERCDAIVCTGSGTGKETPIEKVEQFKSTLGDFPVIVGAGVTSDNVAETIRKCDGMIIGSWFKCNHDAYNMVNEKYVKEFMEIIGK